VPGVSRMPQLNGHINPTEDASAMSRDAGNPPVRFDVAGDLFPGVVGAGRLPAPVATRIYDDRDVPCYDALEVPTRVSLGRSSGLLD